MILSTADSIKFGSSDVDKVYVGGNLTFLEDGASVASFDYDASVHNTIGGLVPTVGILSFTALSSSNNYNGRPTFGGSNSDYSYNIQYNRETGPTGWSISFLDNTGSHAGTFRINNGVFYDTAYPFLNSAAENVMIRTGFSNFA
tara:strand:+ start:1614 stop:2045 length:432 start_codon:yes stop_codon:yes gene_type:complete